MPRFVDCNDEQKFRYYTQPHARQQIARGDFDAVRNEILAEVAHVKATRDGVYLERALERLRRRWRDNCAAERRAKGWAAQ